MKTKLSRIISRCCCLALALAAVCSVQRVSAAAPPVIANVTAAQRAGTRLVDIVYDLNYSGSTAITISPPLVSSNSGGIYNVPAYTFTGDLGVSPPGTGKAIVWYAGADSERPIYHQLPRPDSSTTNDCLAN